MDPFILMVVVFLIYMLSSGIQKRKRERQQREKQTPQEMERPYSKEEEKEIHQETTISAESHETSSQGYDYGEFRKKLRTAWKLPDKDVDEGIDHETELKDQSGDVSEPVRTIPERIPEERPVPIPEEKPVIMDKKQSAIDKLNQEQVRRWQQYAAEQEQGTKAAARQFIQTDNVTSSGKILTEKDAAQWVRYDAIFGEPRSRRPWHPMSSPKGGTRRV